MQTLDTKLFALKIFAVLRMNGVRRFIADPEPLALSFEAAFAELQRHPLPHYDLVVDLPDGAAIDSPHLKRALDTLASEQAIRYKSAGRGRRIIEISMSIGEAERDLDLTHNPQGEEELWDAVAGAFQRQNAQAAMQ